MDDSDTTSVRRRTLTATGINHALHDGYTDLIFVLLPVWQAEFGLSYAALALIRTLFVGTLAAFQLPSAWLASVWGAVPVLASGTFISAIGYACAGASGGLIGLCCALALGGLGSSTQHPLASAIISRTFGRGARGPLGIYNFSGDVGKATVPALVGFLLTVMDWRSTSWLIAAAGVATAIIVGVLLRFDQPRTEAETGKRADAPTPTTRSPRAFWLLVIIGVFDNAARPAFLIYLPFLLQNKGASLATIGIALSLVFVGGAFGKAVCGWLGDRIGVTPTVLLTETGTAIAILAAIALPLAPALIVLPVLGVMLNGTSSVLYGTVPELAPDGKIERAFAMFYTCTLGSSALAMPLLYGRLGDMVGPDWAATAAAATAFAVVPFMLMLSPHVSRRSV